MTRKISRFSATVPNGVIEWHPQAGLSGPEQEVLEVRVLLDWSEVVVGGTGPKLRMEETDPYAVLLALEQLYDGPTYSKGAPTLEDILGPWDPDVVY